MITPDLPFDFPPYRLSGTVYGTAMNHPQALLDMGDAVLAPPYRGAPRYPVLYIKPRNTFSASGQSVDVPPDFKGVCVGVNLGLVVGRFAHRVHEVEAHSFLAGYVMVHDFQLPHESFYRPSIRFIAWDGYCAFGQMVVPAHAVPDPDALETRLWVDGELVQRASTSGRVRNTARLLADVTEFMTLRPGDVLMLGASSAAPIVAPGQEVVSEIDGLGRMENTITSMEAGS